MVARQVITFRGIKYRRYEGVPYFTAGISDRQRKGAKTFHEDIWRAAHGEIPAGHDIHHIDGDPSNNVLSNLQCLTASDHQAIHTAWRQASGVYVTPERVEHLARIRPMTKVWHASDEGRAWHREHGAAMWEGKEQTDRKCVRCGGAYQSRKVGPTFYCSNACKAAARRASGVDDETRDCARCGAPFNINRYVKGAYCSRSCRGIASRKPRG